MCMTYGDYEAGLEIIDIILYSDSMSFEEKIESTRDLQLLELSDIECIKLYEHIDKCNTDFNIVCSRCRSACEKSKLMK